jgi:hypothetical protein
MACDALWFGKVKGRFEETYRLPFQGRRVSQERSLCEADMKQVSC